jgi:hypothetical protein
MNAFHKVFAATLVVGASQSFCAGTDSGARPQPLASADLDFCLNVDNPAFEPTSNNWAECYAPGDVVEVALQLSATPDPVCSAQAFLEYDVETLTFLEAVPGVLPVMVFFVADDETGLIDYAAGLPLGAPCASAGVTGGGVAVTIRFMTIAPCTSLGVSFRENNPPTKAVSVSGDVFPSGCGGGPIVGSGTGALNINGQAPTIQCPFGDGELVEVNADCGQATRRLEWAEPLAYDGCDGELPVTCSATRFALCDIDDDCNGATTCGTLLPSFCDTGFPVADAYDGGGDFLPGRTVVVCTSADNSCGISDSCEFEIRNSGRHTFVIDVELSPTISAGAPGPLVRCMEFAVSECDVFPSQQVVSVDVEFGPPMNVPGHGRAIFDAIPRNWNCVEVRDSLHTLTSRCSLECVDGDSLTGVPDDGVGLGDVYVATFKGSPVTEPECHWLINGNLDGNDVVDIADFTVLAGQYLSTFSDETGQINGDTPCGYEGFHSDLNGDGLAGLADFTFIVSSFFAKSGGGCIEFCDGPVTASTSDRAQWRLSVAELGRRGLSEFAKRADVNGDSWVDLTDMALLPD